MPARRSAEPMRSAACFATSARTIWRRSFLNAILRRTGVAAGEVDGVILGAVEMMGEQAHPGTAIPFLAGFPPHVDRLSVERACTTAMMSVHIAAMSVQCGSATSTSPAASTA
jgi:acetyl-CoA acetyltransferase